MRFSFEAAGFDLAPGALFGGEILAEPGPGGLRAEPAGTPDRLHLVDGRIRATGRVLYAARETWTRSDLGAEPRRRVVASLFAGGLTVLVIADAGDEPREGVPATVEGPFRMVLAPGDERAPPRPRADSLVTCPLTLRTAHVAPGRTPVVEADVVRVWPVEVLMPGEGGRAERLRL
ncbi:MAG TPA: hypothetical protein VM889_05470 [Candidatus Thermoplasmatota archaeon]|nr:hypothetical protein [Candidatus Thermoplasmatota archaeon]